MLFNKGKQRRLGVDISLNHVRLALMKAGRVEFTHELNLALDYGRKEAAFKELSVFIQSAGLKGLATSIQIPAHLVFLSDERVNDDHVYHHQLAFSQHYSVRKEYLLGYQSGIKACGLKLANIELDSFVLLRFFKLQKTEGILYFMTQDHMRLIHFNKQMKLKHHYYALEQINLLLEKYRDRHYTLCNYADDHAYALAIGLAMS